MSTATAGQRTASTTAVSGCMHTYCSGSPTSLRFQLSVVEAATLCVQGYNPIHWTATLRVRGLPSKALSLLCCPFAPPCLRTRYAGLTAEAHGTFWREALSSSANLFEPAADSSGTTVLPRRENARAHAHAHAACTHMTCTCTCTHMHVSYMHMHMHMRMLYMCSMCMCMLCMS